MKALLKKLSEAHGVPGCEDQIRDIMAKELKKSCDEVHTDKLGNLIARKGEGEPSIMLAAHMDEIGLMVKNIDKDGFLKFTTIGGFYDSTLLNQRVLVHSHKGKYRGVIGSKPPHLMKNEERKKAMEYKDMFIDLGLKDDKAAKKAGIRIGDYVTFEREFGELQKDMVTGKAFDNRLGCLALIEIMKKIKPKGAVYAVGTVQEEVGLKGARTAAFRINPDYALAIDVAPSGDYPGVKEDDSPLKLGKGPSIELADAQGRGIITHPKIKEILISTAEKNKIPYQLAVGEGGTTDATAIHLTREGIPSGVVSIPIRYVHSQVEVASMEDLKNTIKLVTSFINKGV